ncbi:MAG: ABC transporter permease [Candidatus Velthaea sp.]|jgi:ribose transport system permease protein
MQNLQTKEIEVVTAAGTAAALRRTQSIERVRRLGIVFGFFVVYGVFALLNHQFMSVANLTAVALQSSINAIIAIGMTLVIISAGIDLSVGSIAGLASVVAATVMVTQGVGAGIAVGLAVGLAAGAINGVLIARLGLAPFIVTLGTLALFRGAALVFTNGQPIYGIPEPFRAIFAGSIGPIPTPVIIAIVCALIVDFTLRQTTFGEHILAIGGNEEAARLCGVAVGRVKALIYVIAGGLAALGGFVLVARIGAAEPIGGTGYELDAIAATVIGGTSLFGGVGTIGGTLIGALILGGLRNGLTLMNVQSFWQQVASGLVIILAVLIDKLVRRAA